MKRPSSGPKARSGRAATRKRSPGRPSGDSGEDQRARLLDAALILFSEQGIAVSTLRSIATRAGVNPSLVHYYFGDKAQLQQAVIEERLIPMVDRLREAIPLHGDSVAELVGTFVRGIGALVTAHPWFPALWVREVLCEGGALRDLMFERIAPQLPLRMAERFARAQRDGGLNPDLDPRLLMVSLVGLSLFPAASAPIWQHMFKLDGLDMQALGRHTLVLLDRGLECKA